MDINKIKNEIMELARYAAEGNYLSVGEPREFIQPVVIYESLREGVSEWCKCEEAREVFETCCDEAIDEYIKEYEANFGVKYYQDINDNYRLEKKYLTMETDIEDDDYM